jgi:hypothetical protein
MSNVHELRPARPDPEGGEKPAYMPKVPWKWIAALLLFGAFAYGFYTKRETEEATAVRTAVLNAHKKDLAPLVSRYEDLIGKINSWVVAAANADKVEPYVDPRLDLDALHKGQGLYLRVSREHGKTADGLITGLDGQEPDAIARCLGLTPKPAAELYARGSFLTSKWIEQAEETDNVLKLRVIAEEIRQRTKRDVPFVAEAVQSHWLMFVLEHGDNRRDAPVDAYLYDLRTSKLLLRKQVKAEGVLVSARIAVQGVKPGAYATGAQTGAAQDCSIANELRALTGQGLTSFGSAPPAPRDALEEAKNAPAAEAAPAQGATSEADKRPTAAAKKAAAKSKPSAPPAP